MGQVHTWLDLYAYSTLPVAGGNHVRVDRPAVRAFRAPSVSPAARVSDYPLYSRISSLVLLLVSFLVADASIDNWTVLRFAGSRAMNGAGTFHDPIFGKPATFYLFDLPFWSDLRGYIFAVVILTILVYWLVARGWQLRFTLPDLGKGPLDLSVFHLTGGLESKFLRGSLAFFLIALAARYYLARFEMVWNQHRFMVGIDYTDDHFALPLYWVVIARSDRRRGADCGTPLDCRGRRGRHQPRCSSGLSRPLRARSTSNRMKSRWNGPISRRTLKPRAPLTDFRNRVQRNRDAHQPGGHHRRREERPAAR